MKKTFVLLTLFIYLFLSLITCKPAWAKLDSCHSFVIWQLTGKESKVPNKQKNPIDLINVLKAGNYFRFELPLRKPRMKLERGDVITVDGETHCGFVIKENTIAHFRSTSKFQEPLKEPVNGEYITATAILADVETKELDLKLYPSQIVNELIKKGKQKKFNNSTEKQTYLKRLDKEIEKKKKNLSIGFYHDKDTLAQFIDYSHSKGKKLFIWKQPKGLRIEPKSDEIDSDGVAIFTAFLIYSDSTPDIKADNVAKVEWEPRCVDKQGYVFGNKVGVVADPITITARVKIITPVPWVFGDDTDRAIYKMPPPKRLIAKAELVVKPSKKKDVTDDTLPTLPESSGTLDQSFDEKESAVLKNCRYLKIKPRRIKGRPGQTIQMDQVFTVIAVMEDFSEQDVTTSPDIIWEPAPTYAFPQESSFNERVQIKAKFQDCTATARIDVEYPFWSAPISDPEDKLAKVPKPPADAWDWYVVCDKRYYNVVYTEHLDLTRDIVIAGPFPGPREPAMWIEENCPRAKCNKAGKCSQDTAVRGGPWGIYCNTKTGLIVVTKDPQVHHRKLKDNFEAITEAQLWTDQHYPSWLCNYLGAYVEDGFGELSSTVGKPEKNTKEESEFAEIGDKSTRKILRESSDATRMSYGGMKGGSMHNFANNLDNIMGKEFKEKRAAQKREAQEFFNEFSKKIIKGSQDYHDKISGGSLATGTISQPPRGNSSDTGLSRDDCVKKFCPICGDDDYSLMGVSTDSQCEDCKTKNKRLIDSCSQGGSAAQRPDVGYKKFKKYNVYLCIKKKWNEWSKVWEERFKCHCVGPGKVRPTGYTRCEFYSGPHTLVQGEFQESECARYWEGKTRIRQGKK